MVTKCQFKYLWHHQMFNVGLNEPTFIYIMLPVWEVLLGVNIKSHLWYPLGSTSGKERTSERVVK
jgi:hypothetical protein